MPRDKNPTHERSDESTGARDNMPTTKKHGGRSTTGAEEVCPTCGAADWETKPVPQKGEDEPRTAEVCGSCGYVTPPDENTHADKA